MKKDLTEYVKGCGVCQSTKPSRSKQGVPLFPITPDPSAQPFSTIALDLIVDLPRSDGFDSILTVTDHDVSKAAFFIPCSKTATGTHIAQLYATHIFPHFGVPAKVISDRDTRFTSHFSRELCRLLGISSNMSTAYHPQTDGQSERTNQWLEQYLRIYVNHAQDNWANLLPLAQFVHNAWPSSTTGLTPFELLIGFIPPSGEVQALPSRVPALESKKQELKRLRDRAQEAIKHAQHLISLHNQRHKKKGKFTPFTLGQKVWLEGTNLRLSHPSAKLAPRRYGPFPITKVLSPVVYQLGLPSSWKIFNTFHVTTTCADYFSSSFPLAFFPFFPSLPRPSLSPIYCLLPCVSPYFDLLIITYPVVHASPHHSYFRYLP
jgi:hypothetical protein